MRWTRATIQTPRPAAPPSPRTGKVAAQRPDEVSKVRNPYLIPGQISTAPLPPPPGGLGVAAAVSRKAADRRGLRRIRATFPSTPVAPTIGRRRYYLRPSPTPGESAPKPHPMSS